jgi:hypothetical protein
VDAAQKTFDDPKRDEATGIYAASMEFVFLCPLMNGSPWLQAGIQRG